MEKTEEKLKQTLLHQFYDTEDSAAEEYQEIQQETGQILFDYYSTNLIHSRETNIAEVKITKLNRALFNKIERKVIR